MNKPILMKLFNTSTDFKICVYHCIMYYVITIYDSIKETHKRVNSYGSYEEAITAAKQLKKQYSI